MKLISLILAFQLLATSVNVCVGASGCEDVMEMKCKDGKKIGEDCFKDQDQNSHSNNHSPCKEECACCSIMQVFLINSNHSNSVSTQQIYLQKTWIANYFPQEFTHLIWHPPQLI